MHPETTEQPSLSAEQKQHVIEHTNTCIKQAKRLFDIRIKPVEINFNLKGRSAGMYRIKRSKNQFFSRPQREIRYNPYIFSRYFEDNVNTTIPHEVAHYVSDVIYGLKNIKPHGSEWKAIMHAFGADDSVTADYDLTGLPQRKTNSHTYLCSCREHQLGAIRHNRIKNNGNQYYCRSCKQILQLKQRDNAIA